MTKFNQLRTMHLFYKLVQDPTRTDLIFKGIEVFSNDPSQETSKKIENYLLANEGFRKMYSEMYLPDSPKISDLGACPEGSFGRAVYKHMVDNKIDFNLNPNEVQIRRPIDYLRVRATQDHDFWHVLLGRSISVEDELAVQAFAVAQFNSPIGVTLITGGLLHLLRKDPLMAVNAVGKVSADYQKGKRAPLLFTIKLNDYFSLPLEEVREKCGIAA